MSLAHDLAETILHRYPDPDTIPWRKWCYVQGYWLVGMERLWQATGDGRYWAYMKRFVDAHVTPAGDLLDFEGDSLDDIMAGTVIAAAYEREGAARYRRAAERVRAAFDDYPRNSDGGFWHGRALPYEMWIDGVFMGGMFLARYGRVCGDAWCLDELARQIRALATHCHVPATGLYLHAWDEARAASWADRTTGLSSEIWSEGLGWYALILVEALEALPVTHPERQVVLGILQGMADGLRRAQDARSGLWYQVVDKGERPDNWCDTSGSAMFVYCLQRGMDLGYLDATIYSPVAQRGYEGLLTRVVRGADGGVDILEACDGVCVQNSYADYVNYRRVINAKEAVGGVLWAAELMERSR